MIGGRFIRTAITIGIVATAPAVAAQPTLPPPTFVDGPAYMAARALVNASLRQIQPRRDTQQRKT
jgi:hypothetical protein